MNIPLFKKGDLLLYGPRTIWDRLVCVKTWSQVSHCEVYAGPGETLAARPGTGVNRYGLLINELMEVLRPPLSFEFDTAMKWFETVRGQRYDWLGLLCFILAVKQGSPTKQFCSEFATNFYRAGAFEPFQPQDSADRVAPGTFCYSGPLTEIYSSCSII